MHDETACDCCHKRARYLYAWKVDGVRYYVNGDPAPYLLIPACSDACAREAAVGTRRLRSGESLTRKITIRRRR